MQMKYEVEYGRALLGIPACIIINKLNIILSIVYALYRVVVVTGTQTN